MTWRGGTPRWNGGTNNATCRAGTLNRVPAASIRTTTLFPGGFPYEASQRIHPSGIIGRNWYYCSTDRRPAAGAERCPQAGEEGAVCQQPQTDRPGLP